MTTETRLTEAMRQAVAGVETPAGIVARAARNRRLARRRTQTASVAGVAGLAAAVAVGVTVLLPADAPAPAPADGIAVVAPASIAQSSFRIDILNTTQLKGRARETQADFTGVYDPVRRRGVGRARYGANVMELRLVGDLYYQSDPAGWRQDAGNLVDALLLDGGRQWGATDVSTADARVVLDSLRARGTLRVTGKAGGLDRYSFRYALPNDGSVARHTMTGAVVVHHDSGLLAEITQRTTVTGAHPEVADATPLTFVTTLKYSDYGVPVQVEAPR